MERDFIRNCFFSFFENELENGYRASEKDGEFILEVDLPGVEKKDVSIEFEDDILKVKSKRAEKESEILFRIRKNVNKTDVKAEMNLGVLKIKMKEKEKQSSKIMIE